VVVACVPADGGVDGGAAVAEDVVGDPETTAPF
jgi:hypothetical protein